ncbi:MAG TPA: phosphopyruvate hydratase, partial [Tepidisphaeraceae bacterium]|nr:phosphopyruvate hydratase [Tepidisphaeraceae bacterium]
GLSPPAGSTGEMLEDAVEARRCAGFEPGKDIAIAVDVASTHFYSDGVYEIDGQRLTSMQMIDLLGAWAKKYPIISFEDGLAEEDWANWPALVNKLAKDVAIMGDDFLCTNPARIDRAISEKAANALLLKVNQIGTLTEAAESLRLARGAGWQVTVSARSGETEDDWLADLAVGFGGDFIKIGSITQSERLAKYNRLLEIESEFRLPLANL